MARSGALKAGVALALGMAIAFPLGMMVGGRERAPAEPSRAASAEHRQAFSPVVARDPYFLAQQRGNAAALERHCRTTGEFCAEARQARGWIESEAAGD